MGIFNEGKDFINSSARRGWAWQGAAGQGKAWVPMAQKERRSSMETNEKQGARYWLAGIPYGPQVEKIKRQYPKPEEGLILSHDDLETLINEKKGTKRYYGIINSWRKYLLNDLGIDTNWIQGKGLKVINPAERLKVGEDNFRQGLRKTRRAFKRTAIVPRDRLDEIGKQRYDHQIKIMAKIATAAIDAKKELAIELAPVRSLPKASLND